MDVKRQVASKPYSAFPTSAKDEIHLVSYRKDKLPSIVGSFAYRVQKYPADIDVMEDVDSYEVLGKWAPATNPNQIINSFSQRIKQIIAAISNTPNHYILDFKAGADERYLFRMGHMENGILTLAGDFEQQVMHRAQIGLYTPEEFKAISMIFNMPRPLGGDQYDLLTKLLRAHYPLRWNAQEIQQGRKTLPLGKVITLEQALAMHQLVKMDLAAQVNGKYMEVSNIWTIFYHRTTDQFGNPQVDANNQGEYIYMTPPPKLEYVPYDIEKLYWSDAFFNPFKVVKRLFSFARMHVLRGNTAYNKYITLTAGFITDDTSQLYQIKSELDTIVTVIKEFKISGRQDAPMRTQIDGMKSRIYNNMQVPDAEAQIISNHIDSFLSTFDPEHLVSIMKMLKAIINHNAMAFLIQTRMNPPPTDVLPTDESAAQLTRDKTVINPFCPVQAKRTYNWVIRRGIEGVLGSGLGDMFLDASKSVGKNLAQFAAKSIQKCIGPDMVAQAVRKAVIGKGAAEVAMADLQAAGGCEYCGGACGGDCPYCGGACGGSRGGLFGFSSPSSPFSASTDATIKKWAPELKGNKSNSLFANLLGYEDKAADVPLWKRMFGEGHLSQVQGWNERKIASMGKPMIRYVGAQDMINTRMLTPEENARIQNPDLSEDEFWKILGRPKPNLRAFGKHKQADMARQSEREFKKYIPQWIASMNKFILENRPPGHKIGCWDAGFVREFADADEDYIEQWMKKYGC